MVMNNTDTCSQVLNHLMRCNLLVTGPVTHVTCCFGGLPSHFPVRG